MSNMWLIQRTPLYSPLKNKKKLFIKDTKGLDISIQVSRTYTQKYRRVLTH